MAARWSSNCPQAMHLGRVGLALLLFVLAGGAPSVPAQDARRPTIDPKNFGFDLAAGPLRAGSGQRVLVDQDGEPVVGRVHCEVGEARVVLLPDGKLVGLPRSAAIDTDRPFQPATKEIIAERWTRSRLKGFQTKNTRHYVFVYNTSEEFAVVTSRILESMVPGLLAFSEVMKLKAQEPELPLVVLMFRTEAEFQRFQRMPPGVVAYYNALDNYIVLYEESRLSSVKRELAVQQTLSSIAHEGAHQILHNIGVQQRLSRWPMWLNEGLAEYLAPTSVGKNLRWKGAGQVNDFRMFELEQYLKSRDANAADGQLIEHTVLAARLTSTGYATAWSVTHYLAKQQKAEFQKYVQEVSRLGPFEGDLRVEPPGIIVSQLPHFKARFGDDLTELERRLVLHLKKLPYADPFAEWPHFVALVNSGNGAKPRREANVFHSAEQAENWRNQTVERLAEDQRGSAQSTVRSFPNRAAAEAFARQWLNSKKG